MAAAEQKTPRYVQVTRMRQAGMTTQEIANRLGIAPSTVYGHLWWARRIYQGEVVRPACLLDVEMDQRIAVYPDSERQEWIRERMRRWGQK